MTVRGALEDYGYNRYPDEKGTERPLQMTAHTISSSYNRYPDEKGTESYKRWLGMAISSYNRYPDEKGTESNRE